MNNAHFWGRDLAPWLWPVSFVKTAQTCHSAAFLHDYWPQSNTQRSLFIQLVKIQKHGVPLSTHSVKLLLKWHASAVTKRTGSTHFSTKLFIISEEHLDLGSVQHKTHCFCCVKQVVLCIKMLQPLFLQHKYATSTHTAASEWEPVLACIIINLIKIVHLGIRGGFVFIGCSWGFMLRVMFSKDQHSWFEDVSVRVMTEGQAWDQWPALVSRVRDGWTHKKHHQRLQMIEPRLFVSTKEDNYEV